MKLVALIKVIVLIISLILSIFSISIPISASMIKIEPPRLEDVTIHVKNNTLFLEAKYLIINKGIYDLEEISLQITISTLGGILITNFREGLPEKNIIIKGGSSYEGKVSLSFNVENLKKMGILDILEKDKAVKIEIASTGRYAFGLLFFRVSYSTIFNFSPPIEKLEVYVNPEMLIASKSFKIENDTIYAILPIKINYKGWLKINNLIINGYAKHNNLILFNFSAQIPELFQGNNSYNINIIIGKKNLILLLSKDIKMTIIYTIKGGGIEINDSIEFFSKKIIKIEGSNLSISKYNSTHILVKAFSTINSYANYEINIATLIKIYDNTNNFLLYEKTLAINLKPNSANEIMLDFLIKGTHGSVIRIELYLKEPVNLEGEPLISEIFIIP